MPFDQKAYLGKYQLLLQRFCLGRHYPKNCSSSVSTLHYLEKLVCCTRVLDEFELIVVECALKIMTLIQNEHVRSRPMLRTGVRSQGVLSSQARREPLGPASCSGKKEQNCRSRCLFFALEIVGHLPQNEFTIYSEVVLNLTSHSDDFKLRCLCFPYSK